MHLKKLPVAYAATLVAFLIFDGLWLGGLMGPTYRAWLGPLMLDTPVIGPAVAFYLMYGVGIVVFAVWPALQVRRLGVASGKSALLGLIAYGTYDLTNWATLRGWPAQLALVDLAWGVVVTTLAATVGYLLTARLVR